MYGEIPYVQKPVSRIVFGTAIPPLMTGQDTDELLDAVLASGINALDLARNYQKSESTVGRWLKKRGCRDKLVLISKCGHPLPDGTKRISESEIRKDFAESSEALGTDFIDIYLLHRDDPSVDVGTVIEIMNALHAEGKIGAFGGSNWSHHRIEEANEYATRHGLIPFSVSSPNFGLAEQVADLWGGGCVSISGPQNQEAREWYRIRNMPIIAYSSLGRGLFSGRVKGNDLEDAARAMDEFAVKGYAC
ncbi:MAG: aldo/keto reductase, partial [Clostridia bacterium]|nr:aldo/keto reductase [Clostridia bacterium]